MNRNAIVHRLTELQNMLQEAKEIMEELGHGITAYMDGDHATIVARNALKMNDKLCQALAYYYTPTVQEYRDFDKHCDEISAAGGCPPNPDSHWSKVAFNNWEFRHDK